MKETKSNWECVTQELMQDTPEINLGRYASHWFYKTPRRVLHSISYYKFAAKMIQANGANTPIIFNVDFKSGHGFDASSEKRHKELQDMLSFAFWQTGHKDFTLKDNALTN